MQYYVVVRSEAIEAALEKGTAIGIGHRLHNRHNVGVRVVVHAVKQILHLHELAELD